MSANTNLSLTHLFNNRDAIVESAPWTDDHIQRCLDHAGEYGAMSDQDFASTLDMLRDATDRRGQYGASIEFDTAYALLFDIDAGCCPGCLAQPHAHGARPDGYKHCAMCDTVIYPDAPLVSKRAAEKPAAPKSFIAPDAVVIPCSDHYEGALLASKTQMHTLNEHGAWATDGVGLYNVHAMAPLTGDPDARGGADYDWQGETGIAQQAYPIRESYDIDEHLYGAALDMAKRMGLVDDTDPEDDPNGGEDTDSGPTTKRNTTPRTRMAARSGERKANTDRAALRARLALQRDIAALTTKLANIPGIPPATGLDTPDNWTTDTDTVDAAAKLIGRVDERIGDTVATHFGGVYDALAICGGATVSKGYHIPTMLRAAGDALVLAQQHGEAGIAAAAQNLYNLLTANGLDMVCYYHGYGRDKGKPCEMGEYIGCAECWCRQYADAHKVAHPQHRCSDCGLFFDSAYFAATDCPYCDGLEDDDTPPPTDVVVTDKVTVSTVAAPVVANYSDHVVVTLPDNPSTKVLADTAEVKWSYTYQGVARELNVVWAYAKRHLDAAQWQGDANEGRVEVGHYQALVAISLSQTLRTMGYAAPSEFKFTFRSGDDWGQRILDLQAFITDLTSSGQTVGRNSRTVPALLKGDQIRCNVGWLPAGITGGEALTFNTVEDNQ